MKYENAGDETSHDENIVHVSETYSRLAKVYTLAIQRANEVIVMEKHTKSLQIASLHFQVYEPQVDDSLE